MKNKGKRRLEKICFKLQKTDTLHIGEQQVKVAQISHQKVWKTEHFSRAIPPEFYIWQEYPSEGKALKKKKKFSDEGQLRGFVTCRSTLKGMQKFFRTKGNNTREKW